MELNGKEALEKALKNKNRKFPDKLNFRYQNGLLFPSINPKFVFSKSRVYKLFTIGSCFARNIEESLCNFDNFIIPILQYGVSKEEWPHRPNGILNEYTPGCIAQRIEYTCKRLSFNEKGIFEVAPGQFVDSLLVSVRYPVSKERALERREEIYKLYEHLLDSDILIITLGYVESWLYEDIYINALPNPKIVRDNPNHFRFRRLNVEESYTLLSNALKLLFEINSKIKVIVTVSPVPIQSTFLDYDCVVANTYSKSVLRVVANMLAENFENVDYFPSYEIVISGGYLHTLKTMFM